MESFRKAYGALKDSTKVGLAKVNSSFKGLDIAIVKATNHVERPPKERHIRKICTAISISCPRADVGYCIHALSKRLTKTRSWIVAIKTLIVFHRILREGDPAFRQDLMRICGRAHVFQISNFKDDSSPLAWDCSAWVRTYAHFLEERIECLRCLNYDMDSDRASKPAAGGETRGDSGTSKLNSKELLEQLPAYQQLLYRLICCQPEGAAGGNFLVQYAFALVVKESFKVYCAINDGIINLVDMFFEMPKHDAVKALDIYKRAALQADHLADFYGFCRTLELAQTFQFPTLRQPPPSFLATMEEYIKEAPQTGSLSRQENRDMEQGPRKHKQVKEVVDERKMVTEEPASVLKEAPKANKNSEAKSSQVLVTHHHPVDLLCLDEPSPNPHRIEESNSLALAIVQPGNSPMDDSYPSSETGKTCGWELALVTAPSSSSKQHKIPENKMAGGFDKSFLDSLYEDDVARRQLQLHSAGYSTRYGYETAQQDLFYQRDDPFTMSSYIQQTAMIPHQQQMPMHHHQHHPAMMMHHSQQNMTMMMQQHQQQQQLNMRMMQQHQEQQQAQVQHNLMMGSSSSYTHYTSQYPPQQQFNNPFGDPFVYPQSARSTHGNHTFL